jgi:hypothetical protein
MNENEHTTDIKQTFEPKVDDSTAFRTDLTSDRSEIGAVVVERIV